MREPPREPFEPPFFAPSEDFFAPPFFAPPFLEPPFFDPPDFFEPPREEPEAARAVSATAFVALPAARAVERAAFDAEREALRAAPPEEPPDLRPPELRPREDDDPPEPRAPLGRSMSAAVGLTPSTVFAADSSAVFATPETRSVTSPATFVT